MKKILLFLCSLVATAAMQAQIIHVYPNPDSLYHTIQSGISAADSGDTILVAEGTYYEQINFLGKKPLMVASEFLIDGDTNHIAGTIINGSQPLNPDSASVVYFVSGEDTTSILCGFTITGGTGTTIITPVSIWGVSRQGGGIWISGSGAKIRSNIITRNRCEDINRLKVESDIGGGIATDTDSADFWIVIDGNVIDSNYVISDSSAGCCTGAGIAIINNCRIVNNIIKNNVSKILVNTIWWSQGAGACIFSIDNALDQAGVIQNNQFLNNINNSNKAFGGGMKAAGGMHLTCTHNTFIGNRVESDISATSCWGGGLEAGNFLQGSVISDNIIKDNYSEKTDAGLMLYHVTQDILYDTVVVENNYFFNNIAESWGGAFGVYDCPVIFRNNVFNGNQAGSVAVGHITSTMSQSGHTAWLINNSFSNNKAETYCGSVKAIRTRPLILNCIFRENSAETANELWAAMFAEFEIAYSDIDTTAILGDRIIGPGVMFEDPLFQDTINLIPYHWSPCIDAGVVEYICNHGETIFAPEYDITGVPRPVGNGYDMGAYDQEYWAEGIHGITNYELRITNWPNPFIESTTFSYTLKESSRVTIQIINSFGQLVDEPLNSLQQKGEQNIEWYPRNLLTGIYYYRIQAGSKVGSGKMIKN